MFSLSNPISYIVVGSNNMEVYFQGNFCSPLKKAHFLSDHGQFSLLSARILGICELSERAYSS